MWLCSERQVFKYRYERLRGVAGRIQNALGDLATMGERVQSLLSWRDPRYGGFSLLMRSSFWAFFPGACYYWPWWSNSWCFYRATAIFIGFCLLAAITLYVTPFKVVAILLGLYALRHPRFRDPLPAVPLNFFSRLPSQSDRILWGRQGLNCANKISRLTLVALLMWDQSCMVLNCNVWIEILFVIDTTSK